ncbi:ligand-gated channel protein [Rhizorhabdus wittichii DC-6]|nr:ligand-gated channel protein [Rhizorhabdus wittichii DC-6]
MKKIISGSSIKVLGVILCMAPAHAVFAAEAGADSEVSSVDSGEIVVTARRRAESLQDVPVSVTAFDQAQLETAGIKSLRDMSRLMPGVQFTERGSLSTQLTIRGVGGDSRNIGIEAGVGMYLDGVYIPRTSGYNADLAEIAQVEVLRGPQGTLFGKNTIGGVINITTKEPGDTVEGSVYASYGNYNAFRTQASISGPLSDTLSAKLTVATYDRDGYIHNIFNDQDVNDENRRGARAQIVFKPSDALKVKLNADFTRDRRTVLQTQMDSPVGAAAPYYTGNRFEANSDQPNGDKRNMWGTDLTAEYSLPNDMVLASISAYRKIDVTVSSDIDQLPINLFNSNPLTDFVQMASQEFRITSPGDGPFRYVGGLYYYHQKGTALRKIYIGGSLANGALNRAKAITNSYAAYINADYDLLPQLTLNGGLRYTYEKKTGDYLQVRGPVLSYDFDDLRRTDKNVSWTGSLTYKPTRELTIYGTVSKGFKSGGFNLDTIGAANLISRDLIFGPESVINYEAGIKGQLFGRLLRYSLAAFRMDYSDKQVAQIVPTGASTVSSVQVTNAGKARIKGFEVEATLRPFEGLSLSGNASYLDAKYTRFDYSTIGSTVAVSYAGNRIEFTPDWMIGGQAEYRFPAGPGEVFLVGSATYTGDMYLQPEKLPKYRESGYTLIDARIGYEVGDLMIALWGKNLTKQDYRTYARVFGGLDQAVWGEPRTYGVEMRYRF